MAGARGQAGGARGAGRRLAGPLLRVALVTAALGSVQHYRDDVHPANEASRIYAALALADHGTVALEPVFDDLFPGWRAAGKPPNVDVSVVEGSYRLDKAPGLSLLAVPVVAAIHGLGWRPGFATLAWLLTLLLCALPTALFAEALRGRLARDGFPGARWIPAATVLASPWLAYGGLLFGHALAAALAGGGLLLALGPLAGAGDGTARGTGGAGGGGTGGSGEGDAGAGGRGVARAVLAPVLGGLLLGLAVLAEYPAALLAVLACAALAADRHRRGRLPLVLLGALPAALALLAWNGAAFGSPLALSYGFKDDAGYRALHATGAYGFTWPHPGRLAEILAGSRRGLLFVAPWLALGLAGAVAAARDRSLPAAWRLALAAGIPAWLLWISGFVDWQAGMTFGPRHLLAGLPLAALGTAVMARGARAGPGGAGARWAAPVVAGLVASSFAACAAAAWTFPYAHAAVANPLAEVFLPVLAEAGPAPTAWDAVLPRPAGPLVALAAALAVLAASARPRRAPAPSPEAPVPSPGAPAPSPEAPAAPASPVPSPPRGPSPALWLALAAAAAALHLALATLPRTPDGSFRDVLVARAIAFEMTGHDDLAAAVRRGMREAGGRPGGP